METTKENKDMSKIDEIKEVIEEMQKKAQSELVELSRISMNSYGTGFEAGSVSTCREILDYIEENL